MKNKNKIKIYTTRNETKQNNAKNNTKPKQ